MDDYYFSAANNFFYAGSIQSVYEENGTWPDDAKKVKDVVVEEFMRNNPPSGMVRAVGKSGNPIWKKAPAPTATEIAEQMAVTKQALAKVAEARIAVLQDAADLGMGTDAEATELTEWRKYRVLLSRVDVTASKVTWPEVPQ